MITKCSDCGMEYSFGRYICHMCGDNTILFGAIFENDRSHHRWNCATSVECAETSIDESDFRDSIIEIYPQG